MLYLDQLSVSFPSFTLEPLDLRVEKEDYLCLLGVSGAGKTVVLELLAGLIRPGGGRIWLNGKDITRQKIQERRIGLVYQDLSLFPHLSVRSNIAYPLRHKGLSRAGLGERIRQLAEETEVTHLLSRSPGTLSGGESQRVALARTLAADPDILLLDEPLSNLDVKLKAGLRRLLRRIHQGGKTIIHVTHDYMEAATLSNKVAVIHDGRLLQHGRPDEVFRHPRTSFVAHFSGVRNLFPCRPSGRVRVDGLAGAFIGDGIEILYQDPQNGKPAYLMIPDHEIILSREKLESSAVNQLKGRVREINMAGAGVEVIVDAGKEFVVSISRQSQAKLQLEAGRSIWLMFKASAVRCLDS